MKLRFLVLASVALTMVIGGCDRSTAPTDAVQAPAAKAADNTGVVPGRYIVVFKDNVVAARVPEVAAEMARIHTAAIDFVYANSIHGFAAQMSQRDAESLLRDDRVAFIEPDRIVTISQHDVTPEKGKPGGGGGGGGSTQVTPWGITRVGGPGGATNAKIWIIDTGIDLDHPDLNVDRLRSANFVVGRGANSPDDGNGHGTHVSGIAAAKNNTIGVVGVAPGASLVAVRVLDNGGSGYYSEVIAGVNYVATNASSDDVANMSLGGPASTALDNAVIALAAKGVKVAVAAGNDGADCSSQSPARVNYPGVYTISAIGTNDCLASWSNFSATTVDYAAPGVGILSTWRGGGTATLSGTSMATPHVTGLLALGSLNSNGTACGDPDGVADPIAHR